MTRRVRALLVDLGNVLVGFDHGLTVERIRAATGVPAESLKFHLFGDLVGELERGRLSDSAFFREVERRAGLPRLPDDVWIAAWRDIFHPLPAALAVLPRVLPGIRKVLVSNTNALHWEGVTRVCDVAERVDALCLSFQVGAVKPEPARWDAALAAVNASAEEAVVADDHPPFVEAARARGLDAFVVAGPGTLEGELDRRGLLA